jgi:hypothetical protein
MARISSKIDAPNSSLYSSFFLFSKVEFSFEPLVPIDRAPTQICLSLMTWSFSRVMGKGIFMSSLKAVIGDRVPKYAHAHSSKVVGNHILVKIEEVYSVATKYPFIKNMLMYREIEVLV